MRSLRRLTSLERYYTVFMHWFNMTRDLLRQSCDIKEQAETANEFDSVMCFRFAFRELYCILAENKYVCLSFVRIIRPISCTVDCVGPVFFDGGIRSGSWQRRRRVQSNPDINTFLENLKILGFRQIFALCNSFSLLINWPYSRTFQFIATRILISRSRVA